jgi:SOS regulatory protein LexA
MEISVAQNRIIRSKPFGISIVKGANGSGKTTAAVHRILYLKNNYCLYEEDDILVVGSSLDNVTYLKNLYREAEENISFEYQTLFSNLRDKVHITVLSDIAAEYYKDYISASKERFMLINQDTKMEIIRRCLDTISNKYGRVRILSEAFIDFLLQEISWIKACLIDSVEEYQHADRTGRKYAKGEGPQRLLKDSKERNAIYDILILYNKELEYHRFIDNEDMVNMAIKQARRKKANKFAHIIVDESHKFTKAELELIKAIHNNKVYSSMMFMVNTEEIIDKVFNPWFIKGRRYNAQGLNISAKTFNLTNPLKVKSSSLEICGKDVPLIKTNKMEDRSSVFPSVESFEYHDIRRYRKYDFLRDPGKVDEITVKGDSEEEQFSADYLKELPVYSDIAAGEPILMSSEQESNFYIPQYWLNGIKDCFILKVKGDSMINANINNSDFVVIRKQNTAQDNDIVAVDLEGSATLKRLSLKKGAPMLMPENPKYSPISLQHREAVVLGIAVGIIKSK